MIRKANVFDANDLTKMWDAMCGEVFQRDSLREEYNNLTSMFINMVARIESNDWNVAIYEIDGNMAGFCMSRVKYPEYNRCHIIGECEVLYVLPEYRGSTIYNKLVNESVEWAKSKGATQFEFSGPHDETLIRFWSKLGYEPVIVTYRQKEA